MLDTLAAIGLAICFALAFAWISVWVGLKMRSAGSVQGVMMLLVLPLTFASSTFVHDIDDARLAAGVREGQPDFAASSTQCAACCSAASAVTGRGHASPVGWTFVWIAGLLVVFFPLAMRAYVRRT